MTLDATIASRLKRDDAGLDDLGHQPAGYRGTLAPPRADLQIGTKGVEIQKTISGDDGLLFLGRRRYLDAQHPVAKASQVEWP